LFAGEFGYEIGWLVPTALLAFVLVLISRGRAPRTDPVRAGALLFGAWLLIDGLVLSYMKGMVHPYYCLSLAPAVAGTVAIGAHEMWVRRQSRFGRIGLTALVAVTGIWSWWVLGRNGDWLPALRWTILLGTVLAAVPLALSAPRRRRVTVAAAALGVAAVLAGPTAYAVATLNTPHRGGGPTVGPATAKPGFGRGFDDSEDNPQLDDLLRATKTKWSAATVGSSMAAGLELSSGTAVMAIGGFTGSDPVPSLGQFKADVSAGQVTYFVVERDWRGKPGGWPGNRNHTGITDWVTATFAATQVGDTDVYDLSKSK
jgi:4-amino-4-deoxy-L-arabinose transferase-like glycosyltransferase